MKPVIVIPGSTSGLGVIRGLGQMEIPIVLMHFDERDIGTRSKYVKERLIAPDLVENEQEFVKFLLTCSPHLKGSLLVPTDDETLSVLSRHKEVLQQSYIVACTEWNITEKCLDKKYTYAIASEIGVPAPKTILPQSLEEVEEYGENVQFPCLIKPSQVHKYYAFFKRKMVFVNNSKEMIHEYQKAKEINLDLMIQEFIPGDDSQGANYNSYFWDGQPIYEFTAHKIRSAPRVLGSPCALVSEVIPEIMEPGRKILKAIGFYGFSCMEFKKDSRDGIYKLMEINARHNLSSILAVHCGLNFPWLQYRHLMYGEMPPSQAFQTGEYWIDIIRDVGHILKNFGKDQSSIKQLVDPYIKPHVFAILDARDPGPSFIKIGDIFRKGTSTLRRVLPFGHKN